MNSVFFLFLYSLSFISCSVTTQQDLCSHLISPVTLKIPTYQQLAPLGNNNGLVGQATWVFESVGSFYVASNITFNVCAVNNNSSNLLAFIESVKLVINTNQSLVYSATQLIQNKYIFNSTWSSSSDSNDCIGGNLDIGANLPSVDISTETVVLSLLDDRGASYGVYFVNGVEGLVGYYSVAPPTPTLLPLSDLMSTGM